MGIAQKCYAQVYKYNGLPIGGINIVHEDLISW